MDTAVEGAIRQVRGQGRPSLSEARESPLLRVRISRELDAAVREAARNAGSSRSEWVRHALDDAARSATLELDGQLPVQALADRVEHCLRPS